MANCFLSFNEFKKNPCYSYYSNACFLYVPKKVTLVVFSSCRIMKSEGNGKGVCIAIIVELDSVLITWS